jgi:hypothetical protein
VETVKQAFKALQKLIKEIHADLKWTVYLALFSWDIYLLLGALCFGPKYGVLATIGFALLSQSVVIFILVREVIRLLRSLPQSEAFETDTERWNRALSEYVDSIKEKKENTGE